MDQLCTIMRRDTAGAYVSATYTVRNRWARVSDPVQNSQYSPWHTSESSPSKASKYFFLLFHRMLCAGPIKHVATGKRMRSVRAILVSRDAIAAILVCFLCDASCTTKTVQTRTPTLGFAKPMTTVVVRVTMPQVNSGVCENLLRLSYLCI